MSDGTPVVLNEELKDKAIYGMVAEFDSADDLVNAGREIHHRHGYTKLDALSPFPVHGIDDAIGIPRSILGFIVFGIGSLGFMAALSLIWFTGTQTCPPIPGGELAGKIGMCGYPLTVGGKPLFAFEPSIPIMFELTILFSAFAAVFGMLTLNGLPRPYHPVFNHPRFSRASQDAFFLVIEATDPKFDGIQTRNFLASLGAKEIVDVEE